MSLISCESSVREMRLPYGRGDVRRDKETRGVLADLFGQARLLVLFDGR